ncbi:MAG: FeoB-associated Cys-rich membrane protein [Ignavibacteriaceae bacterium]
MEIIIGLAFVGLVGFVGYKKFKKTSEGKDCCK